MMLKAVVLKLFDSRAGRAISMPNAKIPIDPLQYTLGHNTQSAHFTAATLTAQTKQVLCTFYNIFKLDFELCFYHVVKLCYLAKALTEPFDQRCC